MHRYKVHAVYMSKQIPDSRNIFLSVTGFSRFKVSRISLALLFSPCFQSFPLTVCWLVSSVLNCSHVCTDSSPLCSFPKESARLKNNLDKLCSLGMSLCRNLSCKNTKSYDAVCWSCPCRRCPKDNCCSIV